MFAGETRHDSRGFRETIWFVPKITGLRAMIQIFIRGGRVIALYAEWASSQQPVRSPSPHFSFSLAHSLSSCPYVFMHLYFSSLLSLSPRSPPASRKEGKSDETGREKGRGKVREDEEGASPGEGEVWEPLHASGSTSVRVITRSEDERGRASQ